MVGQRRQAWCPRCDEVRGARPGSPCQVCSASMVALPQGPGTPGWRGGRTELAGRLRTLLPVARVAATTAVAAALVAGAFVGGRSSRPTAAASAPTTTESAGRVLPGGGLSTDVSRVLRWSVLTGDVTLTLNRITATAGTTRILFEVSGLQRDWSFAGVIGLRLSDSAGRQLAVGTPNEPLAVDEPQDLGGGSLEGTVELPRRLDPNAIAGVTVAQVVAMRRSGEHLRGTLVDAELKRVMDSSPQNDLNRQGPCPTCTLEVHCAQCESVTVAGSTYRDDHVVMVLSQAGRPAPGETLADADIAVSSGPGGQVGSFASSAEGGDTVVEFAARDLAVVTERDQPRMPFDVVATVMRSQVLSGPWRLDQRSGQR